MENKDKKTFVFRVTRTATSCWAEFTVFFFFFGFITVTAYC